MVQHTQHPQKNTPKYTQVRTKMLRWSTTPTSTTRQECRNIERENGKESKGEEGGNEGGNKEEKERRVGEMGTEEERNVKICQI